MRNGETARNGVTTLLLDELCREAVGADAPCLLSRQLARVVSHGIGEEDHAALRDLPDLLRALRRKQLIPRTPPEPLTLPETIGLAACVYPQRLCRLTEEQFRMRAEVYTAAREILKQPDLPLSPDDVDPILLSLTSGDALPSNRQTCLEGAFCYTVTCHEAQLRRMRDYWRTEADLVRCLRRFCPSPPSRLDPRSSRSDRIAWGSVQDSLKGVSEEIGEDCAASLAGLERRVWFEAARFLDAGLLEHGVQVFWEQAWNKLISPFPYYAFQSRFATWWWRCVATYNFSALRDPARKPFDEQNLEDDREVAPPLEASPEYLRWFREGYRLVRTTFFARADMGGESGPASNEARRALLDEIWYRRLENRLDEDLESVLIREVADRFHTKEKTVHILSHRLRLRIWTYGLARLGRLSNARVRSARRPARFGRKGATEYPLQDEPGVDVIAATARAVPTDRTLLWMLCAHAALSPVIVPQRPDHWSFRDFLREGWLFSRDASPAFLLRIGNGDSEVVLPGAFAALPHRLTDIEDESLFDAFARAGDLPGLQREALSAVEHVTGRADWDDAFERGVRQWRPVAETLWITPLWYLLAVEHLDVRDAVARLVVDDHELEQVQQLASMLAAECAAARPGDGG